MIPLIIIAGPTATGKTDLSISLAKAIGGEIISADSMQVYKGFDIGTAKISKDEMDGIKHYLIDEVEPDFNFNVYEFKSRAKEYIEKIYNDGKIPIIVGGTGFYIQSVLYDIDFENETSDSSYRKELEELSVLKGPTFLHDMLREVDEDAANEIHYNNVKRVIRALEFFKENNQKISEHNKSQHEKKSPYNAAFFVIYRDREETYKRINERVDLMMEDGLLLEVKNLLDSGVSKDALSMQGLGYKELVSFLEGECSQEEAVNLIKQSSRHFAKRQITWFKREKDALWVDVDSFDSKEKLLEYILEILKEKKIV